MKLAICPISLRDANELVARWHRHHKPVPGAKFAIAVAGESGGVCGCAIIGRPTARMSDDGWTLEVVRVATDGTKNACSALYGAAWRASREMGYKRLITYTLPEEGGTSLRAAGWKCLGERGGGTWNRKHRPRIDRHPAQVKIGWEAGRADREE